MGSVPRWLDMVRPPQVLPRWFLLPLGLAVGQVRGRSVLCSCADVRVMLSRGLPASALHSLRSQIAQEQGRAGSCTIQGSALMLGHAVQNEGMAQWSDSASVGGMRIFGVCVCVCA